MVMEHLKFEMVEQKPKTQVYSVVSTFDGTELGKISWYGPWRNYCFFPTIELETVWSDDCTLQLHLFLKKLKDDRKVNKEEKISQIMKGGYNEKENE